MVSAMVSQRYLIPERNKRLTYRQTNPGKTERNTILQLVDPGTEPGTSFSTRRRWTARPHTRSSK